MYRPVDTDGSITTSQCEGKHNVVLLKLWVLYLWDNPIIICELSLRSNRQLKRAIKTRLRLQEFSNPNRFWNQVGSHSSRETLEIIFSLFSNILILQDVYLLRLSCQRERHTISCDVSRLMSWASGCKQNRGWRAATSCCSNALQGGTKRRLHECGVHCKTLHRWL